MNRQMANKLFRSSEYKEDVGKIKVFPKGF